MYPYILLLTCYNNNQLKIAQADAAILVKGLPDRIHFLMHSFFTEASKLPDDAAISNLQSITQALLEAIDRALRKYGDSFDSLFEPVLQFITGLINADWISNGPLRFTHSYGKKDDAHRTAAIAAWVTKHPNPGAFQVLHFQVRTLKYRYIYIYWSITHITFTRLTLHNNQYTRYIHNHYTHCCYIRATILLLIHTYTSLYVHLASPHHTHQTVINT